MKKDRAKRRKRIVQERKENCARKKKRNKIGERETEKKRYSIIPF